MRDLISMVLWLPVIGVKIFFIVVGIVVVPVGFWLGGVPKIYRSDQTRPWTIWEMMVRNPVNGFKHLVDPPLEFRTEGMIEPGPTYHAKRFAWRFRRAGYLSSYRCVWRYNAEHYGEMYIGWKLGSEPGALDFALSLRPYAEIGQ